MNDLHLLEHDGENEHERKEGTEKNEYERCKVAVSCKIRLINLDIMDSCKKVKCKCETEKKVEDESEIRERKKKCEELVHGYEQDCVQGERIWSKCDEDIHSLCSYISTTSTHRKMLYPDTAEPRKQYM